MANSTRVRPPSTMTDVVNIRVTPSENRDIIKAAKKAGKRRAEWARGVLVDAARTNDA